MPTTQPSLTNQAEKQRLRGFISVYNLTFVFLYREDLCPLNVENLILFLTFKFIYIDNIILIIDSHTIYKSF